VTVWTWLEVLRRRWLVLTAVLMCTAAVMVLVQKRTIQYQACASVALVAPKSTTFPNVYEYLQTSLIITTSVVTQKVMSPEVQQELKAAGLTATYDAELLNSGNGNYPAYTEPLMNLCSFSSNPLLALDTSNGVIARFGTILRDLQQQRGILPSGQVTEKIIASPSVTPLLGKKLQALIGVGLTGLLAAISIAMWSDSILGERRIRLPLGPLRRRASA
jgi:hypothetical protein